MIFNSAKIKKKIPDSLKEISLHHDATKKEDPSGEKTAGEIAFAMIGRNSDDARSIMNVTNPQYWNFVEIYDKHWLRKILRKVPEIKEELIKKYKDNPGIFPLPPPEGQGGSPGGAPPGMPPPMASSARILKEAFVLPGGDIALLTGSNWRIFGKEGERLPLSQDNEVLKKIEKIKVAGIQNLPIPVYMPSADRGKFFPQEFPQRKHPHCEDPDCRGCFYDHMDLARYFQYKTGNRTRDWLSEYCKWLDREQIPSRSFGWASINAFTQANADAFIEQLNSPAPAPAFREGDSVIYHPPGKPEDTESGIVSWTSPNAHLVHVRFKDLPKSYGTRALERSVDPAYLTLIDPLAPLQEFVNSPEFEEMTTGGERTASNQGCIKVATALFNVGDWVVNHDQLDNIGAGSLGKIVFLSPSFNFVDVRFGDGVERCNIGAISKCDLKIGDEVVTRSAYWQTGEKTQGTIVNFASPYVEIEMNRDDGSKLTVTLLPGDVEKIDTSAVNKPSPFMIGDRVIFTPLGKGNLQNAERGTVIKVLTGGELLIRFGKDRDILTPPSNVTLDTVDPLQEFINSPEFDDIANGRISSTKRIKVATAALFNVGDWVVNHKQLDNRARGVVAIGSLGRIVYVDPSFNTVDVRFGDAIEKINIASISKCDLKIGDEIMSRSGYWNSGRKMQGTIVNFAPPFVEINISGDIITQLPGDVEKIDTGSADQLSHSKEFNIGDRVVTIPGEFTSQGKPIPAYAKERNGTVVGFCETIPWVEVRLDKKDIQEMKTLGIDVSGLDAVPFLPEHLHKIWLLPTVPMTVNNFKEGDRVVYVPKWNPQDTEEGVVTGKSPTVVWVRFGNDKQSQPVTPSDLVHADQVANSLYEIVNSDVFPSVTGETAKENAT